MNSPTWIWYPGDFEVWLGNRFNNRRTERGAMFPPFWKQDSHWVTVEFSKAFELEQPETITIACEGRFNLMLDGKLQYVKSSVAPIASAASVASMVTVFKTIIPAGRHQLNIKVWNQAIPPSLFIDGKVVKTDSTWLTTYEDKIWIDENGVAHGSGIYVPAASWCFNALDTPPSHYQLPREDRLPVSCENMTENGALYDFGQETFGYLKFKGLRGALHIYYGESREEALDKEHCETLDDLIGSDAPVTSVSDSKAFRYVYVECEAGSSYEELLMDYEYAPFDSSKSGSFRCSDEELNKIWEVGAYTMDLTTREFFMDGIKRDRWTWSGDAIQSYLMNYYLRFDVECVKRTIRQLRGKDPVTAHVNTIMDYTFYWFKSVADYYLYTGDIDFVREIYPKMRTLMEYCLERTNAEGMAEGQPDDWIFVDWTDFPMHKRGVLCFEQILFCKALLAMSSCAGALCEHPLDNPPQGSINELDYATDHDIYYMKAWRLMERIDEYFWNEEEHAYMHALEDGNLNQQITMFPNMFAILYDLLAEDDRKREILQHVLLNSQVDRITTPYMRFYELEALCQMGMQCEVLAAIRDYWGGMLREGATTFWEKYNPEESGVQHLAMYGRPYGKSLCHAWGASPVYLLGRYFLGVRPIKQGYEEFEIRPVLGDLQWMEGSVPLPQGMITLKMSACELTVKATSGCGWLYFATEKQPKTTFGQPEQIKDRQWRLWIEANREVTIKFE